MFELDPQNCQPAHGIAAALRTIAPGITAEYKG